MTEASKQMPKFAYLGRGGPLSVAPLEALLAEGLRPSLVIVPSARQRQVGLNLAATRVEKPLPELPVAPPRLPDSLVGFAMEQSLPLLKYLRGKEADIVAALATAQIELVIVSCFAWRIPAELLSVPKHGWWNLHPSLLPAYRGPSPLFWQLRAAEMQTGITLHQMSNGFDEGDIVAQRSVVLPIAGGREIEQRLGEVGGQLMIESLQALSEQRLDYVAQPQQGASYQRLPQPEDLLVRPVGNAKDAYTWITAAYRGYPLSIAVGEDQYRIVAPIGVDETGRLTKPYEWNQKCLSMQFEQGVLEVETGEKLA